MASESFTPGMPCLVQLSLDEPPYHAIVQQVLSDTEIVVYVTAFGERFVRLQFYLLFIRFYLMSPEII